MEKLNRYASNITSLHGEDGILDYIVGALGEKMLRVVCEFGATDGIASSNTYTLWFDKGWKAVLIEGDEGGFKKLKANIIGKDVVAIKRMVQSSGPDSIDGIFKSEGLCVGVGIMSIDIDSYDYHVWKHMKEVRPQVVVIEHNRHIPPGVDYYDPEGSVYLKCSVGALAKLGKEKGYQLVCCTKGNAIFVSEELFDSEKFPNMTVSELFDHSHLYYFAVFACEGRNKYPVFLKGTSAVTKSLCRAYYRISGLFKGKRIFEPPPQAVVEQMNRMGLEI